MPVGGQILLSLDIARATTGAPRRFLEGFRFTAAFFVVAAVTSLLIQLMMAPTSASEDEFDLLTSMAVTLVLVAPVVCAVFVYALVGYPLVERRRGLIDALLQVWELWSLSLWRYVRLALLSVLLYAPGFLIAMVSPVYGASAFWALLAPTVHLAWAHAYLRSAAALE